MALNISNTTLSQGSFIDSFNQPDAPAPYPGGQPGQTPQLFSPDSPPSGNAGADGGGGQAGGGGNILGDLMKLVEDMLSLAKTGMGMGAGGAGGAGGLMG